MKKNSLDLRYRSSLIFRLGILDPYIDQGISKVVYFIKEKLSITPTGSLLQAKYEWVLVHLELECNSLFYLDFNTWEIILLKVYIKYL